MDQSNVIYRSPCSNYQNHHFDQTGSRFANGVCDYKQIGKITLPFSLISVYANEGGRILNGQKNDVVACSHTKRTRKLTDTQIQSLDVISKTRSDRLRTSQLCSPASLQTQSEVGKQSTMKNEDTTIYWVVCKQVSRGKSSSVSAPIQSYTNQYRRER